MASTTTVKIVAPFVAIGVTFLGRKVLEQAYRAATGNPAPNASDPETPLRNAMVFALGAAAIVTVTNVLVDRWVGSHEHREALDAEPATV